LKDREKCRIQLLVDVIFHKLEQNWKSDNGAVHMRPYKVQTANLSLYKQHKTTNLDDMSCEKNIQISDATDVKEVQSFVQI